MLLVNCSLMWPPCVPGCESHGQAQVACCAIGCVKAVAPSRKFLRHPPAGCRPLLVNSWLHISLYLNTAGLGRNMAVFVGVMYCVLTSRCLATLPSECALVHEADGEHAKCWRKVFQVVDVHGVLR